MAQFGPSLISTVMRIDDRTGAGARSAVNNLNQVAQATDRVTRAAQRLAGTGGGAGGGAAAAAGGGAAGGGGGGFGLGGLGLGVAAASAARAAGFGTVGAALAGFGTTHGVLGGVAAGMSVVTVRGIRFAATMEAAAVQLEFLVKKSREMADGAAFAERRVEDLIRIARDSPLDLSELTTATTILENFGGELLNNTRFLQGFVDALSVMQASLGQRGVIEAARQFGQIVQLGSAGRGIGQEARVLVGRGLLGASDVVDLNRAIEQIKGEGIEGTTEAAERMRDVIEATFADYAGGAEAASNTTSGLQQKFVETFDIMAAKLVEVTGLMDLYNKALGAGVGLFDALTPGDTGFFAALNDMGQPGGAAMAATRALVDENRRTLALGGRERIRPQGRAGGVGGRVANFGALLAYAYGAGGVNPEELTGGIPLPPTAGALWEFGIRTGPDGKPTGRPIRDAAEAFPGLAPPLDPRIAHMLVRGRTRRIDAARPPGFTARSRARLGVPFGFLGAEGRLREQQASVFGAVERARGVEFGAMRRAEALGPIDRSEMQDVGDAMARAMEAQTRRAEQQRNEQIRLAHGIMIGVQGIAGGISRGGVGGGLQAASGGLTTLGVIGAAASPGSTLAGIGSFLTGPFGIALTAGLAIAGSVIGRDRDRGDFGRRGSNRYCPSESWAVWTDGGDTVVNLGRETIRVQNVITLDGRELAQAVGDQIQRL